MTNPSDEQFPLVRSVLHPTDLSEASNQAFAHALAVALIRQTQLTILHVGPEAESEVRWSEFPPVRQTLEKWGILAPGSSQSDVFKELNVRVRKLAIRSRNPSNAIARFSSENPTDLIVLATEGRNGVDRWLKRSDAESMARRTRTMTLFVPGRANRGIVSLKNGDLTLRNILIPFVAQPDCGAAIEFARRTADMLGDERVSITLLHVGETAPPAPQLVEGDRWSWTIERVAGDPADEILEAAKSLSADLIVMATAGHDGILDALRGSTTEKVLRRSPCPLLAIPA